MIYRELNGLLRLADRTQQLCTAMPANVVERAQAMIATFDDEDVVETGLDGNVLAWFRNIFRKAGVAPNS